MSKRKRHKHLRDGERRNKPHKTPPLPREVFQPSQSKALAIHKLKVLVLWPWKLVGTLAILLGVTGVFSLLPRLDIVPSVGYEKADDPLDTPLSLSNSGFLPIRIESVSSYIYDWRTASGSSMSTFSIGYHGGGTLHSGDSVDFAPSNLITMADKKLKADLLVIVAYHQWGWPRVLEKRIRFKVTRDHDDKWVWSRPYLTDEDRKGQAKTKIWYDETFERRR